MSETDLVSNQLDMHDSSNSADMSSESKEDLTNSNFENKLTDEQTEKVLTAEQVRFEKYGPFKTILMMVVGPFIYQFGIAIHDAIDLLEISKAYGEREMTIVGFASTARYICMSFAIFFSISCVAKISSMIGEGKYADAGQVVADIYRICLCTMIIVPIVFYFITPYILILMGCAEDMAYEAQPYILPILCCMPFISFFQLSCGILESQGRSIFVGFLQITAFILNCGFFSPIFLFGFKVPFTCAGLGFAFSQAIPGIILSVLLFSGKFASLVRWENLVKKPIKESLQALKLGSPFIINCIMGTFPPILMINFMMSAAASQGIAGKVGSVYSVFLKLQPIVNSFSIALGQSFLASGSYAHGANKDKRVSQLFTVAVSLALLIQIIFIPLLTVKPSIVTQIWLDEQESIEYSNEFVRSPFYTNWNHAINEVSTALLQCLQYGWLAMLPSILRGIFYLAYAPAFYYTNKTDPINMLHVYNASDMSIVVLDICLVSYTLYKIWKQSRQNPIDSQEDVSVLDA